MNTPGTMEILKRAVQACDSVTKSRTTTKIGLALLIAIVAWHILRNGADSWEAAMLAVVVCGAGMLLLHNKDQGDEYAEEGNTGREKTLRQLYNRTVNLSNNYLVLVILSLMCTAFF